MSNKESIDSWFAVVSTYAYLTVAPLDEVSNRTDLQFTWRPKR
jgi:2-hydroxychromene-2-carboxylate isomerase